MKERGVRQQLATGRGRYTVAAGARKRDERDERRETRGPSSKAAASQPTSGRRWGSVCQCECQCVSGGASRYIL